MLGFDINGQGGHIEIVPLRAKDLVPRTNPFEPFEVGLVPTTTALHGPLSILHDTNHYGSREKEMNWRG